jgi:PAS domain S-box-containing protein
MDRAILEELGKSPSDRVDILGENLDILRFSADRFQRIFTDYLTEKYAEQPPDLIILVFVGSLEIAGRLLHKIFPGTPVVVAGATEEEVRPDQFLSPVGGVAYRVNPRATLELILRLQPETRRVIVIGGTAQVDRHVLDRVKDAARSFATRVEFEFWDNRSMAELRQAVSVLPPQTAILFCRMFRDGAGQPVISTQAGQAIAQWANVPVYVMADTALGTGAVGGSVGDTEAIGKRAGELARLVLSGAAPASLPLESSTGSVPTFDWRALKRWGIPESRLPPDSVVRFKPPSMWEQYRWYIIGALAIIAIQAGIIADLLLHRARRRRAEADLRESEQRMGLAASAANLDLWTWDVARDEVWVTPEGRNFFGWEKSETINLARFVDMLHPEDREPTRKAIVRSLERGDDYSVEYRVTSRHGAMRWIAARGQVEFDSNRKPVRMLGVAIDVTERKRGEQALRESEERFRLAVEASPNAIVMTNQQGRIVLVNVQTEKLFGYSREELIGHYIEMLVPELFRTGYPPQRAEFLTPSQGREMGAGRDLFGRRKDGSVFMVEVGRNPIHTNEGVVVLTAVVDITERKRAEEELQLQREELAHLTRVSTMGELAASLAHELNQPLTAILSNAQAAQRFLAAKPADLEEVREILKDIVQDNNRAGDVIRRLRALVKKEALAFAPLDLEGLIRDVVALVRSDAVLHNVRVLLEFNGGLPPVQGDRVQLQQVVVNLLLNAFDAMKDFPASEREVVMQAKLDDHEVIEVSVRDRGTGLTTDKIDNVFQPFYTTKREGLGMGLSISRSIIDAHGGRLWAENNPDRGATFYFTVPVAESPAAIRTA